MKDKITISFNEEDVQNIINAYEKDIEYIKQLEKENQELKEENEKLRKYKKLSNNDIEVWDDDLEYIKALKLQRYELKEQIKTLELLLVESNKEVWELKDRIDKAVEYATKEMIIVNDNEYHRLIEMLKGDKE